MGKQYYQFMYSANPKPVFIEGSFIVNGSGVIPGPSTLPTTGTAGSTAVLGGGILGAIKTGTGQYQIKLVDNFNRLLDFQASLISPTSAAGSVTDGSLVVGKPYQIVFPSTSTNWATLGLNAALTPAYGMPFVATSGASNGPSGSSGATAAGNGVVIAITNTGIAQVELLPNPNLELGPIGSATQQAGSIVNIQTLNGSGVPTSPTSGSVIRFNMVLRQSSLLLTNETATNY